MRPISIFTFVLLTMVAAMSTAGEAPPAAPAAAPAQCGNALLDAGETCASCPVDCTVAACRPGKARAVFAVDFTAPEQAAVGSAVLRIGYRSDRLSLPGTGTEKSVRERIASPQHAVMAFNDLDYAVRVVAGRSPSLPMGRLFTIELDRCEGAPAPSPADLSCTVEACAGSTGPVDGCACWISAAAS